MNAKVMTRFAVFAVAGSLLAGCATQQGTNTAVGTGVGAGTGAALGAIFGGFDLAFQKRIVQRLGIGEIENRWALASGGRWETAGVSGARSGVEVGAKFGAIYARFAFGYGVLDASQGDVAAVLGGESYGAFEG